MAKLILRFDTESAMVFTGYSDENREELVSEACAAVTQVCKVLKKHEVPATFFIVGILLERAGERLASVLRDTPLVDLQSHTYSHMFTRSEDDVVVDQFRQELRKTSDLLHSFFGKRPMGVCCPGNFYRGLQGVKKPLQMLRDEGYLFVGSDGSGPPEQHMPAPFTQPYWYAGDGFPDLLELPLNGWHCNMLFNTGGQNDNWQPATGWPDGTILKTLPETVEEGFHARAKELQHAIDNDLVYTPSLHPWSIYRFDPELEHLDRLIEMAKENDVPVLNAMQLYEEYRVAADSNLATHHIKEE